MVSFRNGARQPHGHQGLFPGLVLHLDPDVLRREGALCEGDEVEGDHFFLCVSVEPDRDETFWVPLSSKARDGRVLLPSTTKRGDHSWVRRPTYAVGDQLWLATSMAVFEAARVARQYSCGGARNRLTENGLRMVLDHVG